MAKIKKGDNVIVIAGKDKGTTGEVLRIVLNTRSTKVVVKGVNIVTIHQKPNQTLGTAGAIVKVEKPVDISNVMLIDAKTNKPTRVGYKLEANKKVRVAKKSGSIVK